MATRNTFVAANSQQRPDECWFVIGAPSRLILILKFCASAMVAERCIRTLVGSFEVSAESANRFLKTCQYLEPQSIQNLITFGSCINSFSHCSVVLMDIVGDGEIGSVGSLLFSP